MPYQHRTYTYFQYIAWEVPTAEAVGAGDEPGGREGFPDDPVAKLPDDQRIRVDRLYRAAEKALLSIKSSPSDDDKTLKLFMAPEFYFRPAEPGDPSQPFNSYSESEANLIKGTVAGLFAEDRFADWLIVAGTVVWNKPMDWPESLDVKIEDKSQELGRYYAYYNTAIVTKGGLEGPCTFVDKQDVSSTDEIPKGLAAHRHPDLADILGSFYHRARAVFEVDNVRFGLEICMDHQNGALVQLMKEAVAQKWERTDVDLHLLTCCGQKAAVPSCVAKPGGYLLHVDGRPTVSINDDSKQIRNSGLFQPVEVLAKQELSAQTQFEAKRLHAESASTRKVELESPLAVPLGPKASKVNGGSPWKQHLVIYPRQRLP